MDALGDALRALGFAALGCAYGVREMPRTLHQWFVQPDQRLTATIAERGGGGPWLTIGMRYESGARFNYTTVPPHGLDDPPGTVAIRAAGLDVSAMHARVLAERPEAGILAAPATPEEAALRYEESYAETRAWRVARGGYLLDEAVHSRRVRAVLKQR